MSKLKGETKEQKINEVIYHYTSKVHLKMILKSGELRVSDWEKKNKVKPAALWLSLNPIWENTATKNVSHLGNISQLKKNEQHKTIGLIRFVLEFKKKTLCSWGKYKYVSNTPIDTFEAMETSGIHQDANPEEWYASFKNIPLNKCISCQEWDGKEWITIIDYCSK